MVLIKNNFEENKIKLNNFKITLAIPIREINFRTSLVTQISFLTPVEYANI